MQKGTAVASRRIITRWGVPTSFVNGVGAKMGL